MIKFINFFGNKILNLNKKVENINTKKPELIILIFYCILHVIISFFHEPWFDEAVAWQISKVANIKDILFEIPHYEGHPPLWHLVLLPFAKLGVPYEFSLSFVSLIFSGITIYLILWRSPFPRLVKLLLPFNYFIFYQYGVISRPYCMMMLAFVLLAITYKKRNDAPFLYVINLMFLCMTSAYGIVIAGGIAIAWIIEIIYSVGIVKFVSNLLKDKRIYSLMVLLVVALVLISLIIPKTNTYATANGNVMIGKVSILIRVLYMLVLIFADLSVLNVYNGGALKKLAIDYDLIPVAIIVGGIILSAIFYFGRQKKKLVLFVVPYLLYGMFSAIVYSYAHHIGILFLFLIFWSWVTFTDKKIEWKCKMFSNNDREVICNFVIVLFSFFFITPVVWNVISSTEDIIHSYSMGREEAQFIYDNQLSKYDILTDWRIAYEEDYSKIKNMNTVMCDTWACVAPYFSNNIVYNFMNGDNSKNYIQHKNSSEENNLKNIEQWHKKGYPDVILGPVNLEVIFDKDELTYDDYALVFLGKHKQIWKCSKKSKYVTPIFIKKDLLEESGLVEIDKSELPWGWHVLFNGGIL